MNRMKAYFVVGIIMFLLLIPFKCFSQTNVSLEQVQSMRENLVTEAKKYVGSPYIRGATGPNSFDCSGLVFYVARESIQVQLPRTVKAMYGYVKIVPNSEREIGDLVFFKTTGDGTVSHVGIYIGNGQFISAVSDGPNTGVIVSSLRENYWKRCYASTGKFLQPANMTEKIDEDSVAISVNSNVLRTANKSSKSSEKISDKILFDSSISGDWSFFSSKKVMPNFRGITAQVNLLYKDMPLNPGIGTMLKWNYGVGIFQVPVIFSLSFGNYVRAYAGPVFTFGKAELPDTNEEISASIFPGMIGISWQTPSLSKKNVKVHIFQDISYSVFNNADNSSLSFIDSVAAGLVFNTGLRVTFPFSAFF